MLMVCHYLPLLKDNGVCIYDTLLQNPVKLLAYVIPVTGILTDCTSGKDFSLIFEIICQEVEYIQGLFFPWSTLFFCFSLGPETQDFPFFFIWIIVFNPFCFQCSSLDRYILDPFRSRIYRKVFSLLCDFQFLFFPLNCSLLLTYSPKHLQLLVSSVLTRAVALKVTLSLKTQCALIIMAIPHAFHCN